MDDSQEDSKAVKSTEKAVEILEYLAANKQGRISQIAQDTGMAKSTVHRHLYTLRKHRLVGKEADIYYPGLGLLKLGELARNRKLAYPEAGKTVEDLANETGERSQFVVEEQRFGVYVYGARGEQGVKTNPRIGKRLPLHATATGKAILAHAPDQLVEGVIERGLERLNEHTITGRDQLLAELEEIRERGYSSNNQENIVGLRAVGVPIKHANGALIGALSVSGPIQRFKGEWYEETLPQLLLESANELEINIEHVNGDY